MQGLVIPTKEESKTLHNLFTLHYIVAATAFIV
jgi:hypothetical protein